MRYGTPHRLVTLLVVVLCWPGLSAIPTTLAADPNVPAGHAPPIKPEDEARLKDLQFAIKDLPQMDGSEATEPLSVMVACKLTGTPGRWDRDPSRKVRMLYPVTVRENHSNKVARPGSAKRGSKRRIATIDRRLTRKTLHSGTHGAYVSLIDGIADLILVARKPSKDELRMAKEQRFELDLRPVALDALAFLVHRTNPVTGLTTQQIHDIYTGKTKNWQQLGGADLPVNPLRQSSGSAAQQAMEELVMKEQTMTATLGMTGASLRGYDNVLAHTPDGIGFSSYYYSRFMAASQKVKVCEIEDVTPGPETIRSGRYPYITKVYAVCRKGLPAESSPVKVRDWLLTRTGQTAVAESGFVPVRKDIK